MKPIETFICTNPQEIAAMERSKYLCNEGNKLYGNKKYEEALVYFQQDLVLCEEVCGAAHSYVANSLVDISNCYRELGNFDQALLLSQRAFEIYEKSLGSQHRLTAHGLSEVSICFYKLGRNDEAILHYQRVVDIRENIFGADSEETALALRNMGLLYFNNIQYTLALLVYERAFTIFEKINGKVNNNLSEILNSITEIYEILEQWSSAITSYERLLKILEKLHGKAHESCIVVIGKIAKTYEILGEWDNELPYRIRLLPYCEKTYGLKGEEAANIYNRIAQCYFAQGLSELALPYFIKLLKITESIHGLEHAYTLIALTQLAIAYEKLDQMEIAIPILSRIFCIWEKVHKISQFSDNSDDVRSLKILSERCASVGDDNLFQNAINILEKYYIADNIKLLDAHPEIETTIRRMGPAAKAPMIVCQRALKFNENTYGYNHDQTIGSIYALAVANQSVGQHEQALILFQRALKIYETKYETFSQLNEYVSYPIIERIIEIYERFEKFEMLLPHVQRYYAIKAEDTVAAETLFKIAAQLEKDSQSELALEIYMRAYIRALNLASGEVERLAKYNSFRQSLTVCRDALLFCNQINSTFSSDSLEALIKMGVSIEELSQKSDDCENERLNEFRELFTAEIAKHFIKSEPLMEFVIENLLSHLSNLATTYEKNRQWSQATLIRRLMLERCESHYGIEHENTVSAIYSLEWVFEKLEKWEMALSMRLRGLKIQQKSLDMLHPEIRYSINHLACLYGKLKQLDQVILLRMQLLIVNDKVHGIDHANTFFNIDKLADAYEQNAQWEKSLPLRERLLAAREKTYPVDAFYLKYSIRDLAKVHDKLGQHEIAQALRIRLESIENESKLNRKSMIQSPKSESEVKIELAQAYAEMGDWKGAEELLHEALEIRELILGRDHADTLKIIDHLIIAYEKLENYEQMKTLLFRRVAARTKAFIHSISNVLSSSPDDYLAESPEDKAAIKLSLYLRIEGEKLRLQGNNHKALELFKQDQELWINICDAAHCFVARSCVEIALCFEGIEKYDQALQSYQRAVVIHENFYGADHPLTIADIKGITDCSEKLGTSETDNLKSPFKNAYGHEDARTKNVVSWLAFAYGKLSQNDKAIALLQSELLKLEISHNCHSERYLNFNLNLAYLYKDREQWDNVIPLLQRDFEICKKLYGPMHTKTLESLNRLAWVYAKLSKWNQVVKLDLQVLMGYEKIFGISHFETHSSIKCLAYTYEKMEEWEKSLSLRLRSLKIVENHYGTNHLETARSLEELAGVYEHLHQFDNALPLLQRAIEIRGENNVEAKYLFNMAGMMEILCHFELAKELRNRTYANAILSACCEAKLFEDFDRIGQAVSVCMETWSNWETIEPPKNLEAKNALLEFSETLQRLRLNGNTSETIGITEAIQNILIKIEFLTDALVSLAIDKANELIGQYSLEVTEDNYNIIYWAEHEIYPAAHHSVFGYLKHLLKGGEVNERFEQASMKNDFNMKAINVAALIFLVAKEREIPYERVLNYLKSHLPESEVSIPAIFQKIMVIYPAMNEAGLMGEIKCLAGVVCGAILDSDQFSYNAAQINEDFDKVGLIVKFCNGLES